MVAPMFTIFDLALKKRVGTGRGTNASIEVDFLKLFNAINFDPTGLPAANNITNPDTYRVDTSLTDPGARTGQIVVRFHW